MKILVAGDYRFDIYEESMCSALENLGHSVDRFSFGSFFNNFQLRRINLDDFFLKIQNRFIIGPAVRRLNSDFIKRIVNRQPEIIVVNRGTHLMPDTLRVIWSISKGPFVIGINNDDPFSNDQSKLLWRHFIKGLPFYHLALAYRQLNIEDFHRAGCSEVRLLRPWFDPKLHHRVKLDCQDRRRFESDVVFIGHFEADGRLDCLEAIAQAGFRLRLFGTGWDRAVAKSDLLRHLAPITPARGMDYNRALCGARIALCFLSKLNRDTYTRRCFEIPATGTLLLSEFSADLARMFKEGVEADFFRNKEELIAKVSMYLGHEENRVAVAAAGLGRVWHDQHHAVGRMQQVLDWYRELRSVG